jgi:hypothetical protein
MFQVWQTTDGLNNCWNGCHKAGGKQEDRVTDERIYDGGGVERSCTSAVDGVTMGNESETYTHTLLTDKICILNSFSNILPPSGQ